jgi:hypothetical protein
MELDTINKLYLELSQVATARTAREISLEKTITGAVEQSTAILESTANFLRGMSFDPRISQDIKEAILSRVAEIDKFTEGLEL